jgi:hypothetical protein
MALVGYEVEKQKIDAKIAEIRARLAGGAVSTPAVKKTAAVAEAPAPGKRRTLSAAARKRIAAAQRKRWAEHRKKLAAAKASA